MRTRFMWLWLMVAIAAVLVFRLEMAGQAADNGNQASAAQSPASVNHDSLFGVWNAARAKPGQPRNGFGAGNMVPKDVQYTAWGQAKCESEDHCKGFNGTADPARNCDPLGPTRVLGYVHPFEIVHASGSPDRIFLFYEEDHQYRTVYMDGRPLLTGSDLPVGPTYMGYSVGHWDGNDLIIETAGLNDKTWIDATAGHVHSEELKITERYHPVDPNDMELSITFNDPKAYKTSWTWGPQKYELKTGPMWELQESDCVISQERGFEKTISNPELLGH